LNLFKKIPRLSDIAAVYAVIVVMIYYPTINRFFWKFPSWILFSTLGDLFSIYSYMVLVNFLESLLVLGSVLMLCIVLPRKWFYDQFLSKSVLLVVFTLSYFLYLGSQMQSEIFPWALVRMSPYVFLAIVFLVFLLDRVNFLRKFLAMMADRFTVFLYISIPISVLSVLVVLVRNLF